MKSNYTLIPLQSPTNNSSTDFDDDLRRMKRLKAKQQEEERLAEAQRKKVESQVQSKFKTAIQRKKQYTYDYNGMPIVINSLKPENLPPTTFLVQHGIKNSEAEVTKNRKILKEPLPISSAKLPQKTTNYDLHSPNQEFQGVQTYELLKPQAGVTYFENGLTKNSSSSTQMNVSNFPSGSLISKMGNNPRLSKLEYQQLVNRGNFSLQKRPIEEVPTQSPIPNPVKEVTKVETNVISPMEKVIEKVVEKKKDIKRNSKENRFEIFCDPNGMNTLLKDSGPRESPLPLPVKQQDKGIKQRPYSYFEQPQKKSFTPIPSEVFDNEERQNLKETGNQFPKLAMATQKKQIERTIGVRTKYPRERANHTPTSKNYLHLLHSTLRSQQIA